MEEVRLAQQQQPNKESMKKEECQRPSTDDAGQQEEMAATATTASGGRFNPTEAILATMQLLPLPCAKVMAARSGQSLLATFMTASEIERNVSLVRSYAGGGHKKTDSNLAILALRRKSKSQMGLNDAHGRGSPAAAAAATTLSVRGGVGRPSAVAVPLCDQLDELRSFQRQLQNFPSLSELQRHPLVPPSSQHQNYWLATGTSSYSNNRRSLSPATSRRWLLTDQQCQPQGLSLANVMIQQPSSQSPISRSTSHSSSEESRSAGAATTTNGRHQHNTESFKLSR